MRVAPLALVLVTLSASAQPGSTRSEEIVYTNGDLPLAATLLLPPGDGPFPGAVLVHGSGTSSRSNPWTSAYAEALVARGIAVLHPDKRGSGASGGDWREASFEDLARDAVAGFSAIRGRPEIADSLVGFIGFSQGGHVVPVASGLAPEAAFVVSVSASVVPLVEQIGDEIRQMGEREGLSDAGLETVQALHALSVRYALTGEGWTAYAEALAEATAGPWGQTDAVRGFPDDPDALGWRFLRTVGDFDPLPYWCEVDAPTLFFYGGRDQNVDVFESARVIQDALTPAGLNYVLMLFRENGHGLYREDAMDFLARWIRDGGAS